MAQTLNTLDYFDLTVTSFDESFFHIFAESLKFAFNNRMKLVLYLDSLGPFALIEGVGALVGRP